MYLTENEILIEAPVGSTVPSKKFVTVFFRGGQHPFWSVRAETDNGMPWLSASPSSGLQDADVQVNALAPSLPLGTYTGRLRFFADSNVPQVVKVTLRIRAALPTALSVIPGALSFISTDAVRNPEVQKLNVTRIGELDAAWRVSVTTATGGSWLSITPASGTNNGVVQVSVARGTLAPGTYAGTIRITSETATNSPVQVPVTFTIAPSAPTAKAEISPGNVLHAALNTSGPVAPGLLVAFRGRRLGPVEGVTAARNAQTGMYPTALAGTRVTFDDTPGALLYVSDQLVLVQVPYSVAGKSKVKSKLESAGFLPGEADLDVVAVRMGLFMSAEGRLAAINQDGTVNSATNPAPLGSILQVLLTGAGVMEPAVASGFSPGPGDEIPRPAIPLIVRVEGRESRILFAGLAPGSLGAVQLNIELPKDIVPGIATTIELFDGTSAAPLRAVFYSSPAPQELAQ